MELVPDVVTEVSSMVDENPRTAISVAKEDEVVVRGFSITHLMGNLSFGDTTFLVLTGKLPNPSESRIFNALLVSLIEHGIATQALAARWVIRTAPESVQGGMAAAILGVGDQFGGVAERVGEMLSKGTALAKDRSITLDEVAEIIIDGYLQGNGKIPGLGHPTHRGGDPRAARHFEIAAEEGFSGQHIELMQLIRNKHEDKTGRQLVINVMGAIGAIVLDLGLDWRIAKGLMVISKTPGILAHIHEEITRPIMPELSQQIRKAVPYDGEVGKILPASKPNK